MHSYSIVPKLTAKMSILLWITIEMEYKIKCLKFILFFTNGRQKLTAKGLICHFFEIRPCSRNEAKKHSAIQAHLRPRPLIY